MENKVKNTADANDSAGATKLKVSGSRKKFYTKETVGNLITQRGIFLEVYLPYDPVLSVRWSVGRLVGLS